MALLEEINEFLILPPAVKEFKWNTSNTKMLIDLYGKNKKLVGTMRVKTLKQMWDKIAGEIQDALSVLIIGSQCENKWKVLDRTYKKFVDNQNSTGRGRKYFEFYEEMQEVLGKKKSVCPELLLTSDLIQVSQDSEAEKENDSTYSASVPKFSKSRNNGKYRVSVLENIRQDRLKYQEFRMKIEQEKLKALVDRNKLMEERNKILQEIVTGPLKGVEPVLYDP